MEHPVLGIQRDGDFPVCVPDSEFNMLFRASSSDLTTLICMIKKRSDYETMYETNHISEKIQLKRVPWEWEHKQKSLNLVWETTVAHIFCSLGTATDICSLKMYLKLLTVFTQII